MRIRRAVTMATVGAASAASLVLSAGAASATVTPVTIWKDGQWKTHAEYNSNTRQLCVQGYNNLPGANSAAYLYANGWVGVSVMGNVGDCVTIKAEDGFWTGRTVQMYVQHTTSGGAVTVAPDHRVVV